MKLKDWLNINKANFSDTDLRFLIKDLFSKSDSLILEQDEYLDPERIQYLEEIKRSYFKGIPLAYLLGKEDFFGREFKVDKRVLIPRKETEILVEKAIDIINKNNLVKILDLCCGCSNIAITVKKSVSDKVDIFSSDISLEALLVSKDNVKDHNVDIRLINSDLLEAFKYNIFDLIISNPPYVEKANIKGSLDYEPRLALEAGSDGLVYIEKILEKAHLHLKNEGYFIMEMGYNHKDYVDKILRKIDRYEIIEWIKDYSGNWRGVILKKRKVEKYG
jgi:release factor glutamine methyltransferase